MIKPTEKLKELIKTHKKSLTQLGTLDMLDEMTNFIDSSFIHEPVDLIKMSSDELYNVYNEYKDFDIANMSIVMNGDDAAMHAYNDIILADKQNNEQFVNVIRNALNTVLTDDFASAEVIERLAIIPIFVAHKSISFNFGDISCLRIQFDSLTDYRIEFDKPHKINEFMSDNSYMLTLATLMPKLINVLHSGSVLSMWFNKSQELNDTLQSYVHIVASYMTIRQQIIELKFSKTFMSFVFDTYIKPTSIENVTECWSNATYKTKGFYVFQFKRHYFKSHYEYIRRLAEHLINCRYELQS